VSGDAPDEEAVDWSIWQVQHPSRKTQHLALVFDMGDGRHFGYVFRDMTAVVRFVDKVLTCSETIPWKELGRS